MQPEHMSIQGVQSYLQKHTKNKLENSPDVTLNSSLVILGAVISLTAPLSRIKYMKVTETAIPLYSLL